MDKTYTIIPDFMLDFGLSLTETVALAVIYGFCQDGESDFHGSYNYIARKCRCSRQWAIETISSLVEKGYVSKRVEVSNGVKSCYYRFVGGSQESLLPVKKVDRGSQESLPGGSQESLPNNISIENIKENIDKKYIKKFDFLAALRSIGVSKETAQEWLQVRKTKRLTNTKIAFDRISEEIQKTGRPAEDCIRLSVENSWGGFKADWMPVERKYETMEQTIKRLTQQ